MVVHEEMSHATGESRALARLTFEELARGPGGIWAVHRAIASRAFAATGPPARAVQMTHDAISSAVYGGLQTATTLAGRGAEQAIARRAEGAPPLSVTP